MKEYDKLSKQMSRKEKCEWTVSKLDTIKNALH